jgi:glutamyl endopeptidase
MQFLRRPLSPRTRTLAGTLPILLLTGLALTAQADQDPHRSVSVDLTGASGSEGAPFFPMPSFDGAGPSTGALYGGAAYRGRGGMMDEAALLAEGVEPFGADRRISDAELDYLLSLPEASRESGREVLLGIDTRVRLNTRAYPARAVVLIVFEGGRCTGFMIGPRTVATAGHCVHSGGSRGAWHSKVRVFPAFDYNFAPYSGCAASSLFSVAGWVGSADERFDYGAIGLGCTVGNRTGWFGFRTNAGVNTPTIITGYPGDKSLTMWQSSDVARAVTAKQLFYTNDTVGGMSGSPVWEDLWYNNRSFGPYAVAIHAYGPHGSSPHNIYNHGTRIDTAVFNNLKAWKNAN